MIILGIESSCDETSSAIVEEGTHILSHIISSQISTHAQHGGVIPELASQLHLKKILPVIDATLTKAALSLQEIDLFAATKGPGLIGALLIGVNTAKSLALACRKPFIGVNHLEAHLYASIMDSFSTVRYPALALLLSGGHTAMFYMKKWGSYHLLGETRDDAVGEAFDKVASMLHLPYPGGPSIEKLALKGDPHAYPFTGGKVRNSPLSFSLSGLKTKVLYTIQGQNSRKQEIDPERLSQERKENIAASFQRAVFQDIATKISLAHQQFPFDSLILGGGVCNNQGLRIYLREQFPQQKQYWPTHELSLDNGAMIAGLAYHLYKEKGEDSFAIEPSPRMPLHNI